MLCGFLVYYTSLFFLYFQMQSPDLNQYRSDSAQKAKNFMRVLGTKNGVYFMHFLADVVGCLSDLSQAFQLRYAPVSQIWLEIDTAISILSSYKQRYKFVFMVLYLCFLMNVFWWLAITVNTLL